VNVMQEGKASDAPLEEAAPTDPLNDQT